MDKQEAAKLLSLIKLSYPTAYRDIDKETANATVNMWQMSFPDVPYPIMEHAFNHFRMVSKFPPTVAEMVEELKQIHFKATECALTHRSLGNEEGVSHYRAIMECTARFKDSASIGYGGLSNLRLGGGVNAGRSRNRMDRENRLSLLDAGG